LLALLAKVTEPLAAPAAFGVNATLNDTDCPAERFIGKVGPLAVKAAVDEESPERITVALPVLDTLTVCEAVLPMLTLPRFKLAGFGVITPA
jgi:hypothetical protein